MKTAISVEDSLMEQADSVARDMGLSRSALVAQALREYLLRRRQSRMVEQLNSAYEAEPTSSERQVVRKLRAKLPVPDSW